MGKKSFIYFLFLIAVVTGVYSQTTGTWVPGTFCQNCPSGSGSKLGSAIVANGNNTLVTTYTQSACGLNYTQVSRPLFKRNFAALGTTVSANQPAPFVVTGIPVSANVIKAFLYAGCSGGTGMVVTPTIVNQTTSVTATYTMTNIGSCADKCWGYGGTQSYRADVTNIVTNNGTYILSGMPVMPQTPNYDIDGATLFIIYADPSQNFTGNIVIADGCQGITGTVNSVIYGFNVCGTPSVTNGFAVIGDLQRVGNTNFRFNSTTNNFLKLSATDLVWDFVSAAAAPATFGQTSANFGVSTANDCYSFLMTGMYYQNSCLSCCGSNTNALLSVTINSTQICSGSTATLVPSPAGSYTWQPGNVVSTSLVVTPTITTYYSATILNTLGCGGTVTPVVVDPPPPIALSAGPQTVCPGLTSLITCTGAATYTLFPGGISGNPIPVNPTVASVYTVAGTSSIGCTASRTVGVSVYSLAPVIPTATTPICAGQSLSLTVNSAFSYTWNGPGNYLYYFRSPLIANATNANSGIYTVTVLGPNNCINSATLNVVVNPQAYVIPTVAPIPLLCNTTPPFNLTVTPTGGGWIGNPGVNNTGLITPALTPTGITTAVYTVYVGPCLNSTTLSISTSSFYPATLTSSVPNLCVTSAPFNLMSITLNTVNGVWMGPGVSGSNGVYSFVPSLLTSSVYPITYSTTSSPVPSACSASSQLNVTVTNTLTPQISPVAPFCTNKAPFNMTVTPSGGTWFGNGIISPNGVLTPSLAILSSSVITYSVLIGPCINTNTAPIYPSIYYSAALSSNNASFCVTSNPANLASYVQNTVNGSWSGTSVLSGSFLPAGLFTNTYNLVYSTFSTPNATLCPESQTLTAHVLNPAVPNINIAGPFCSKGSAVQLTVNATMAGTWIASSYLTTQGIFIPTLSAVGNNLVQYVVGTNTCSAQHSRYISVEAFVPATITNALPDYCNTSAPVNLTPFTLSNSGVWSGSGISGSIFNPGIAGAGVSTLLHNTSSFPSGLCPDQATLSVKVFSLATPVILPASPLCNTAKAIQLIVSPLGGQFSGVNTSGINISGLFNPGLAAPGQNIINYKVSEGPCIATAQTTVMVEALIPATFIQENISFCRTDASFNLNSLVLNTGGVWSGKGITGSMFSPADAHLGSNNVVTYETFSMPGLLCRDRAEIRVTVDDIPSISLESNSLVGCIPHEAIINVKGPLGGTGEWSFGDNSEKQSGLSTTHLYSSAGSYSVVYSYSLGSCRTQTTLPLPITVYEYPAADFDYQPKEITISSAGITFNNLSTPIGNNTYEWEVQGQGKKYEVNPIINFTTAGNYTVKLIATSLQGCKSEVTKRLVVENDFAIFFPNSFTPNGDGINDIFIPVYSTYGIDIAAYEFEIFDRWGGSVFKTNELSKGWNGVITTKNPFQIKEDIYVYKVRYKDLSGKLHSKTGTLTLLSK